eukprot:COSAG04_NODE_2391_length_4216_cov_4.177071_3_plen_160_part_00
MFGAGVEYVEAQDTTFTTGKGKPAATYRRDRRRLIVRPRPLTTACPRPLTSDALSALVDASERHCLLAAVHADQSFLPAKHSAEITEGYANYVEISAEEEASPRRSYRNTFIVSSWAPSLSDRSPKPCPDGMACLITYGETVRSSALSWPKCLLAFLPA